MDVRSLSSTPKRPLLALTLAVLALHAFVLQLAPASFSVDEPMAPRRMIARGILLQSPSQAPAPDPGANARAARSMARIAEPAAARSDQAGSPPALEPAPAALPAPDELSVPVPVASAPLKRERPESGTGPGIQAASDAAAARIDAMERPAAVLVPGPARLSYRVSAESRGAVVNAAAELLWQHDGRSYEARFSVGNLLRTRVQTSRGAIAGQGLVPARFSDKTGSERAAHFERGSDGQGGQVVFSANSPVVALAPGAQDRLSLLVQLAAMLAGDPARLGPGSEIVLQVVGAREADIWVFRIDDEQALELAQGPVQAIRLTRSPRREYDQKVEIWLARAMGYLPARIRITEPNGNVLDQKLEKLETP